ncbi:uncharacterized protein LOC123668284 [Melitaea cinxia]|uniref:uncharacterized protein LOC123668284 n=1 Tax=Melitaea cinxia TaxID=113334 RepID=UPI001E27325C|nr:uncharacterized protein LOC123668284 [Melitaea cinxia]
METGMQIYPEFENFFRSYDTRPPPRRAPKSHAERQRRYILRKKQKRLEEYLKEIKNASSDKIEPAELSAVARFLTNPPPRPPPKTHAERQRLYILRKKQKRLEEYLKQTQNANGDNAEAGELSAITSNLANLQPRQPPKSHAERQRRYMIRKKQKMLEEKLKKAQNANDDSCENADLSADTSSTSLPSRKAPKTNAERQRDFRLRQKERKCEENGNKPPKKSRAAYLRQYRAKRKLAAMMKSDFVEVVLREETEGSNLENVATDFLTQLSPDTA